MNSSDARIFICQSARRIKPARRIKAIANLRALISRLPRSYQTLLAANGVRYRFHARSDESGASIYSERIIELNAKEFSRFDLSSATSKPSRNQRWAFSTLKEEAIHFLATHYQFDNSSAWLHAAKQELAVRNPHRKALCKRQRKYDSAKREIKLSPSDYRRDRSVLDKIVDFVTRSSESAEELLVDLLLARDYLETTSSDVELVKEEMLIAFPNTYRLAIEFDQSLDEAADRASGRAPGDN